MASYRPTSPTLSPTGYQPHSPDSRSLTSKYNDNPYQSSRIDTQYNPLTTSLPFASPASYAPDREHFDARQQAQNTFSAAPAGYQPSLKPLVAPHDMPAMHMKQEDAMQGIKQEPSDPTMGVVLKTSFPVARIKRIMQADEDIGKVAQVTPHVVSRALELFMIKLIVSSSEQARGPGGASAKGPRRVLAQHMKRAIQADDTFDFLAEIIGKVPDAPTRSAKKESNSDSEGPKPKKRAKKKVESDD